MGKISDKINDLIVTAFNGAKYSSAGDDTNNIRNYFIDFDSSLGDEDIEAEIEKIVKQQSNSSPQQSSDNNKLSSDETKKRVKETEIKVDDMLSSNLGDIKSMSTEQFGNIRQVATNPFGFMTRTVLRKLRTGAGILFIVAIATEVAKFLIDEMFKPGRAFDQRFREQINHQIIQFTSRKEQEELRAGYKSVITTTIGGLRGGMLRGQIGGNFYSSPFTNGSLYRDYGDNKYVRFPSKDTQNMGKKKSFQSSGVGEAHAR